MEKMQVSVLIHVNNDKVWAGLTDPYLVKKYFFGTTVESTWQKGSPIFFRGEWQNHKYEDKGVILRVEPGVHVTYSYWSSLSGTPDRPENYKNISYDLSKTKDGTKLTVSQDCDPKTKEHSEKNWTMVLNGLKNLLENS